MRIWLNPAKLNNFHLTTNDVITALQAQNVQVSAGQFGGAPAVQGQQLNATIIAQTLLQTTEQFDAIILRTNPDGSTVRLKDVAGRSSAPRTTRSSRSTTANRWAAWPSGWRPAPTPWKPPTRSRPRWRS